VNEAAVLAETNIDPLAAMGAEQQSDRGTRVGGDAE
jgi:hypothetical protein